MRALALPLLLLSFLLTLLGLTAPARAADPATTISRSPVSASYRVGEGDVLLVEIYGEEDMSGLFVVGIGGVLNYPIVNDLPVKGLTTAEISETLRKRLEQNVLYDPRVAVRVDQCLSQQVNVLGAVNSPGEFFLCGPTSVLDMVARAGGVKDEAVTELWLKRGDAPELKINYDELLNRQEQNIFLEDGDRLYVPAGLVVYVTGEVKDPGSVPFRKGMTYTQALSEAGGLTAVAKLRKSYLLRDGSRETVRLRKILEGGSGVVDPVLMPNDQIIIEESSF